MFHQRLQLHKKRLTFTVLFSSIIPAFLVAACVFFYAMHSMEPEFHKEGTTEILAFTHIYSERIHLKIESARLALDNLCDTADNLDVLPDDFSAIFAKLRKNKDWLEGMAIVDGAGRTVITAGTPHVASLEWLRSLLPSGGADPSFLVTDVQTAPDGIPHFFIAAGVGSGAQQRIVYLSVNAFVFSLLVDEVRLGRTGEVFIINQDGVLQTRSVLHGAILGQVDELLTQEIPQAETVRQRDWQGTRIWYAILPVAANPDWRLVVQRDEREILQARDTQVARFTLLGVLGLFLLVAIAARTIKKIRLLQDQMEEERARLTDFHIQVQKLDAISQLGVGIAHEVNNPLAIIGEEAGWMQDVLKRESFKDHPDVGELRDSLHQIVTQTGRSREITHKLLSFGGKTDGIIRDTNLNTLVADVVTLRRREASLKNIEIREDLAHKLPIILSEPSLLRQLLINLINNSIDAMPDGGQITVSTAPSLEGGVQLRVLDTGFGIPEENLCKIFNPFFTTKPPGKGAGLGLSICHGILQRIGGQIFVSSEPGKGTTATIELPLEARPFGC